METKGYKRLTFRERVIIETFLSQNMSAAFIAGQLNRSKSTISRELRKWIPKPDDKYNAKLAHWAAQDDYISKKYHDKISSHPLLRWYVYRGLIRKWSPEQIAGRIKAEYPGDAVMTISYESIYVHIYKHRQAKLNKKLIALLPFSRYKRRNRGGPKSDRQRIKDPISIENRPAHVELREEVGHWEGDLMIGARQASAIGTLVERKSRYTHIVKLKDRKSETVTLAFRNKLSKMNSIFKKTLTYDNGMEMANHKWFTQKTGMPVYFAHPYSSWERGTNENTNGLIRRFFPKGTDFNKITEEQIMEVENKLNNRPRKIIYYLTPLEFIEREKRWWEERLF
jgi:transposase, IS30 family